jgi:hypothetical protein
LTEQSSGGAWHPDPTGLFDHRYWDGAAWTEHVVRDGEQSSNPLPVAPPVQLERAQESAGRHVAEVADKAPAKVGMMERLRVAREAAVSRKAEQQAQALAKKEQLQSRIVSPAAAAPSVNRSARASGKYAPTGPHGEGMRAWTVATDHFEVAGETHYAESFRRLFAGTRTGDYGGAELLVEADLIAAPDNPFDRNAVAVFTQDRCSNCRARGDFSR